MPFFQYDGRDVYYEELGNGQPLALLHGNTASSKMFADVAEAYARYYKVILIDFLGHGRSDRLNSFPPDLWFDEARQLTALLEGQAYGRVNLIGSSGGALAAINAALEKPELIAKVIADSFEGEKPLKAFTQDVIAEREASKKDPGARAFYYQMHGDDWEQVVDNDTQAIARHDQMIGRFFHQPLENFRPPILMTGSKEDEFVCEISRTYFEDVYGRMLKKIGHGDMHLFNSGGHPAMLSNPDEFVELSRRFFDC